MVIQNGINKIDIFVIKVRFGITILTKVDEPRGTPYWSPTLKAKQVYSVYPSFKLYILGARKNLH